MSHYPWIRFFFYVGYGFLYIPLLLIVIYSFNRSQTIAWESFSWHWYRSFIQDEFLWQATLTSFKIAFFSACLSVVLGMTCAHFWMRPQNNHPILGFLATMPLVVPEIVMGLAMLLLFVGMENQWGWPKKGQLTVIAAHTTLGAAYVTAIIRARLSSLDPALEEAALDLGAKPYKVFFLITLPLIFPALVASWLIAFIVSFDDLVLASFTSGPGTTTLPLIIFSSIKIGYTPQINALAACILLMLSLLIVVTGTILYRKDSS